MDRKKYFTGDSRGKVVILSSRKYLANKAKRKYRISIRRSCELFKISRTAYYYVCKTSEDRKLIFRIISLAAQYPSCGYWKIYFLLLDEGFIVNHKHVYRIYKEFGLTLKKLDYDSKEI